jgi:hypothetical protein
MRMDIDSGVETICGHTVITLDHGGGLLEFCQPDLSESRYLCPLFTTEREYWELLAWILRIA